MSELIPEQASGPKRLSNESYGIFDNNVAAGIVYSIHAALVRQRAAELGESKEAQEACMREATFLEDRADESFRRADLLPGVVQRAE